MDERFFELFESTTLSRLRAAADARAEEIRRELIEDQLGWQLTNIRRVGERLAKQAIGAQGQEVRALDQALSERRRLCDELYDETKGKPKAFFEARCSDAEQLVAEIDAVLERLEAR